MWKCPKCGREFNRQEQDHYCVKPETVDAYIAAQEEAAQPRLRELRAILQAALPDAQLYPGGEATTLFAEELKDLDVSKGTIRLPYNRELPADLITRIAQWCGSAYGK